MCLNVIFKESLVSKKVAIDNNEINYTTVKGLNSYLEYKIYEYKT